MFVFVLFKYSSEKLQLVWCFCSKDRLALQIKAARFIIVLISVVIFGLIVIVL